MRKVYAFVSVCVCVCMRVCHTAVVRENETFRECVSVVRVPVCACVYLCVPVCACVHDCQHDRAWYVRGTCQ